MTAAVRIITIDGRPTRIFPGFYIRARADSDVELLAIFIKEQTARPVIRVKVLQRDDLLAVAGRELGGVVGIALDRIRFADVQIVLPQGQSVRPVEAANDGLSLIWVPFRERVDYAVAGWFVLGFSSRRSALTAVRQKDLAFRALQHKSGMHQILRPGLNNEPLWRVKLGALGFRDYTRTIVNGKCCVGPRQWGGKLGHLPSSQ